MKLSTKIEVICNDENLVLFIEEYLIKKLNLKDKFELDNLKVISDLLFLTQPVESSYNYHNNYYDKYEDVKLDDSKQMLIHLYKHYKLLNTK